jgi:RNA polymerase sigma-54 factor
MEHLDERGFLITPLETIAALFNRPVDGVLATLQTFDPPGIFARTLQEALLLQLRIRRNSDPLSYEMIAQCFEDLLHGRYAAIKKKLGATDLSAPLQILSRLSLRPASTYKQEIAQPTIPDLVIEKIDGGWTLQLREDELPKFHIQTQYLDLEPEGAEEKELLRGFKTEAKWVFRALDRRRKMLRAIGRILLHKQATYLDQKGPLTPFTVRELSEKLQVHESTLSRALAGKYAATPRGILPLRALLTTSPIATSARELLRQCIASEDKRHPFTDDELVQALKAKGFPIARRTIAKYRSQLKIGPATQRKHLG